MTNQSTELTTHTGLRFRVRPARPDDEAALREFFEHVTPQDLRFRFLGGIKEVGHDRLVAMIKVAGSQGESVVAYEREGGPIIAAAMLACDAQRDIGEVAVSIRGGYRNRGIGWELLGYLSRRAQALGMRRLQSLEDRSNLSAIQLEKEMGFTATPYSGEASLVLLEKMLAPAES